MIDLENCDCATGMGNLGKTDCPTTFGGLEKFAFTNLRGSDGTLNKVAAADVALIQTYIDGKIQNLNVKDRWYFSPTVTDFKPSKEDPDIKEFDDKTRVFIDEGRRSFMGLFVGADPIFKAYLDKVSCGNRGFYVVSDKGNLMGLKKDTTGDIYPLPIEMFYSKQGFRRGENDVQNVNFVLDLPINVLDTQLSIAYSVSTSGDLVNADGLIQLDATLDNATTSTLDITLVEDGAYGSSEPYLGLEATDMTAYDVTAAAAGTIGSVTSLGSGVFTVTFTGATSTNVMRLTPTALLLAKGVVFTEVELALA